VTLPDLPIYVHLVPDDMALTARVRGLLPRGAILTTGPLPGADGHVLIADLRCHVADIPAGRRTLVLTDDSPVPDSLADCFDIIDTDGLDARLPRAVRALVEMEALRVDAALEHQTVHTLNEIGYALAAITDHNELLNRIVQKAREAVKADAGTLYLVGDDHHLYFTVAQNDTIPFPSDTPHLAVDKTSLAGWCVHQGTPALIDDVYRIPPDAPYQWNTNFDDFSGYRTHSMLLVPLFSRDGTVAGALALINRKARMDIPISPQNPALPFTQRDLDLARSIAAQAAVALDNFRLYAEIRTLFDGFVDAAVTTIEARDPTTGGHSKRVAALTLALARAVHEETEPPFLDIQFCEEDIVQIQFAGMLHDFGKVAVREQILLKAEKLYPWELERIEARFRVMAMQVLREAVQDEGTALPGQLLQLQKDLAMVRRTNRPDRATTEQDVNTLSAIAERWRLPDTGEPILADVERDRLRISRGASTESSGLRPKNMCCTPGGSSA